MNRLKKHKNALIILVAVVLSLTVAYFWGGKPRNSSSVSSQRMDSFSSVNKNAGTSESYEIVSEALVISENTSEESYTASETFNSERSALKESRKSLFDSDISLGAAVESSPSGIREKASGIAYSDPVSEDTSAFVSVPEVSRIVSDDKDTQPESAASLQLSDSQTGTGGEDECFCSLSISCNNLLDKTSQLKKNKRSIIPRDGIILEATVVAFEEGENVFDVTKRLCQEKKIPFEFTLTPFYQTAYIEGIGNLYEFDCGSGSGWIFVVNSKIPGYGCSQYKLKRGDTIEWIYTCDLGHDVEEQLRRR